MYERRVLVVEQASFTPLVFTTTGGMGRECLRYHSRLAELISIKKGEDYAKTMTWIRGKLSFSILRPALICLRGSRSNREEPIMLKTLMWTLNLPDLILNDFSIIIIFYFLFFLFDLLFFIF